MRSKLLFIVAIVVLSNSASAQRWLVGTGLTYCSYIDKPGINLNLTYRVVSNLHVGPDFSALLTNEIRESGRVVKKKELEYNLNAHYLFEITEHLALYPLMGVNFSKVTIHPESEEADKRVITGFNSGGGLEWSLSRFRIFVEAKHVNKLSKTDITGGVMFELNKNRK